MGWSSTLHLLSSSIESGKFVLWGAWGEAKSVHEFISFKVNERVFIVHD